MNFLLKVFISIVLGICSLGILFASFFSSKNLHLDNTFLRYNTEYPVQNVFLSGAFEKVQYSAFEDIYSFSSGSLNIEGNEGKQEIILDNSRFLSSFRDPHSEYTFTGKNFFINQKGIGELFIDTETHPNKVLVFALTAGASISLIGETQDTIYTTISLTPHMYLEFQPARGASLKNADRIRVETIYNLGYFPESLQEYVRLKDNSLLSRYFSSEQDLAAFGSAYSDVGKQVKNAQVEIAALRENSVFKIPGYSYIQRYMSSFVNPEKQKVFYKNIVLESFINLISSKEIKKSEVMSFRNDMKKLNLLDNESYEQMKSLHMYILSLLLRSSDIYDVEIKKVFSTLINEQEELSMFNLYMYSLFAYYDLNKEFLKQSYVHMLDSYEPSKQVKETEYFLYFLEKQLSFLVADDDNTKKLDILIQNYNYFIHLTDDVYKGENSRILTGVYIHADILSKMRLFLEKGYFSSERDVDGLLQIKNPAYTLQSIQKLENLIGKSLEFYTQNLGVLSPFKPRDIEIKRRIAKDGDILEEYFLALQNSEEYRKQYDTIKRDSLNISIGDDNKITLDVKKARVYLSRFIGASLENTQISVDGDKYSIKDFNVSGKTFDFDLYPTSYNLLTKIYINDVKQPYEYQLDIKEEEWNEKNKTASGEEKNNYDFSRFFLITFFQNNPQNTEFYIEEGTQISEDKTEIVFKRDILLGSRGEFTSMQSFFPIQYSDIRLEKQKDSYAIYIDSSMYNISVSSKARDIDYMGEISAQYILGKEEKDRYFTRFVFTAGRESGAKVNPLLGGNKIQISGRISKKVLQRYLENFFTNVNSYNSFYQEILQIPNVNIVSIKYSPITQKVTYTLEKGGNTYTILTDSQKVSQVLLGTKRLLSSPVDINQVSNYIK